MLFLIFLFGFIQFYSFGFFAKYFDYIYNTNFTLLIFLFAQLVAYFCSLLNSYIKITNNNIFLYFLGLNILIHTWLNEPVFLIFFAIALIISINQLVILKCFNLNLDKVAKIYNLELIGGIFGIFTFHFFSANLGLLGYVLLQIFSTYILIIFFFKKKNFVVLTLLSLITIFFLKEPGPILDKRDHYNLVNSGSLLKTKWDPNGHVEAIENNNNIFLSYEGGILRSSLFKFDGDFYRLKSDYLQSISTGTWGLDVVSSHYLSKVVDRKVALISCVGGQELLAAKAFGAKSIFTVDINKSAQEMVSNSFNTYTGHIFDDSVKIINQDGRRFIENTNEKFDIIQIYSSTFGTFSAALGTLLQPSSLFTKEALEAYTEHLTDEGILQITTAGFFKLNNIFSASFGEEIFSKSKTAIVFKRDIIADDLITVLYRPKGWNIEDVTKLKEWLNRDKKNQWQFIYYPSIEELEREKNQNLYLSKNYFKKETNDNWPFFRIFYEPMQNMFVRYILGVFFLMVVVVVVSLIVLTKKNKKIDPEVGFTAFLFGATFSLMQCWSIYYAQKNIGLPSLGISVGVSTILVTAILANFLYRKINFKIIFSLLLILSIFIRQEYFIFLLLLFFQFLQSCFYILYFTKSRNIINLFLWFNGIGFISGLCLYNLIFIEFNLQTLSYFILGAYLVTFGFLFGRAKMKLIKFKI